MAKPYGALSDAEIAWVRNQMSKGTKAAKSAITSGGVGKMASKGVSKLGNIAKSAVRGIRSAANVGKSIYPSISGAASVAGKALTKGAGRTMSKLKK